MSNTLRTARRAMERRPAKRWVEAPEVVFRVRMDRFLRSRLTTIAKAFATDEQPLTAESLALHLLEVGVQTAERELHKKEQEGNLVQVVPGGLMGKLKEEEGQILARDKQVKTGGKQ